MPTKSGVIIIDAQHGFLDKTEGLTPRLIHLAESFPAKNIFWMKYRNHPDSSFEKFLNWSEVMVSPQSDLIDIPNGRERQIYPHFGYGLPDKLQIDLIAEKYDQIGLAGVDTDACVYACAFNLWDMGIRPVILADYCASSGGQNFHDAAMSLMYRQFGTKSVLHDDVRPSDLSGPIG